MRGQHSHQNILSCYDFFKNMASEGKAFFDPLAFLSLHIDQSFKEAASQELLDQLSQYFVIRFVEILPEEELKSVNNIGDLFQLAQKNIPEFDSKVKNILEDFQKEYQIKTGKT